MNTPLIYLPTTEVFRRSVARFFAARSQNAELNVSVRTRQAMAVLLLVMACLLFLGFGELSRQAHHRAAGRGTVMDSFFIKEAPTCEAG